MLTSYEITAQQARRWAAAELGDTLSELRHGIDAKLGELRQALQTFKHEPIAPTVANDTDEHLTADSGPALLDLLKSLPGVIGQSISGDPKRVDSARETLANLQARLQQSGIDVDDRVKGFADRLASIRTEAAAKKDEPPKE